MVFMKVTYQKIVRRFSIPDDYQYDDLRKKIVEMFPELKNTSSESLVLYYRDPDNDLVAISSNEELHTAEQLIGEDKTLKLLVGVKAPEEKKKDDDEDSDLFDLIVLSPFNNHHPFSHRPLSLFDQSPFTSLFSFDYPSWSDRRRQLREQEERLRRRREYEEKIRKAHLEHLKELNEKAKKAAEEERKKQVAVEGKQSEGGEVKAKEGGQPVLPSFPPGWSVNPYGSWEPVVHKFPGGTTTVWGPWGYTAYYGEDSDKSTKTEKNEEPKQEDEPKKEEPMEEELKKEEPTPQDATATTTATDEA